MYKLPLIREAFVNENETRKNLSQFIIENKSLSMGNQCSMFEDKFSKKQERKYSVLFNSGGSANLALLQSLLNMGKIKKNQLVGVSALTWSTNVMPIIQLGLYPVPIDIDSTTLNVNLEQIEKHIKLLNCLFITNALGIMPLYTEKIKYYCDKYKVILIEDNCESLGSIDNYYKSGNVGLASTFSFYIAHHLSTIEGGMVCTDDVELYNHLLMVRANGWARNVLPEYEMKLRINNDIDEFYSKYSFYDLGYNLRPTEITGFIGNEQIKYIDYVIENREKNYYTIMNQIANKKIMSLDTSHMKKLSSFCIPFIFKNKLTRDAYRNKFQKLGIEVRPIIAGDMTKQPFWKKYIEQESDLPNTRLINDNGFYCGNFPQMTNNDIDLILEAIK